MHKTLLTDVRRTALMSLPARRCTPDTTGSTGGIGAASYGWLLDDSAARQQGASFRFDQSPSGTTMGIYVKCNVVTNVDAYITVTATDSSGAAATPGGFNINVDFS